MTGLQALCGEGRSPGSSPRCRCRFARGSRRRSPRGPAWRAAVAAAAAWGPSGWARSRGMTAPGRRRGGSPSTGWTWAPGGAEAERVVSPVVPDGVPRDGEGALARCGRVGEGAARGFTPGAGYPLAGLLLALPPLAQSGVLACARQVYGRLRNGFYGLEVMLVVLVFMALLREARAEGATRIPPAALGRVLGPDRAPEVKTIRRKLAGLAAAGKAGELQLALARHHAAASPDTLGLTYIDGHTRAQFGERDMQKLHLSRLTVPRPATRE